MLRLVLKIPTFKSATAWQVLTVMAFGWREPVSADFDKEGKMLRIVGMVTDITERKKAEAALADVSRRLIEAQEQERSRIARELHDDIGERLSLLAVELRTTPPRPSQFA